MKRLYTTLSLALALATSMWAANEAPKANAETDFVASVGNFLQLRVTDGINVVYHCNPDSAGMVSYRTTAELSRKILLSNNNKGRLTIQLAASVLDNPEPLPTLHVYSSTLTDVQNNGDSTLTISSMAPVSEFRAELSNNGAITITNLEAVTAHLAIVTGKGTITASGRDLTSLQCRSLGTGTINALNLPAYDINARVMGTSHIYCTSLGGKLTVKGAGSGKVHYAGKPSNISVKKIGSVNAEPYLGEDIIAKAAHKQGSSRTL